MCRTHVASAKAIGTRLCSDGSMSMGCSLYHRCRSRPRQYVPDADEPAAWNARVGAGKSGQGKQGWSDHVPPGPNRLPKSKMPLSWRKNPRFSGKKSGNCERFTRTSSIGVCPKSVFAVAVAVSEGVIR